MKRAAISPNAVARKLDSNLGSENQGKVLGVDSTGAVVPVEMSSGAKLYIVSGTITNVSGSYTTTINNEFITAEMKAVEMELGAPSIFGDKITVTCGAGFVTISCPSVSGTSTYKISLIKSIDDPTAVTSTEFDILSNRIGTLSNLHTTDKTTIVAALNENTDAITKLYETGSWTPTFGRDTAASVYATWTRVGNLLFITADWQNTHGSGASFIGANSLPIPTGYARNYGFHGTWRSYTTDVAGEVGQYAPNDNMRFSKSGGGVELPNEKMSFSAFCVLRKT